MLHWSCNPPQERYNSGKSDLEKEIPAFTASLLDFIDPTFRTSDELAGYLAAPVLAPLPKGGG
jgi:hypothetical protein